MVTSPKGDHRYGIGGVRCLLACPCDECMAIATFSSDMTGTLAPAARPHSRRLLREARPLLFAIIGTTAVIALFLDSQQIQRSGWILYAAVLVSSNLLLGSTEDCVRAFLSPPAMLANYVAVWFLMGSVGYRNGWVPEGRQELFALYHLDHLSTATSYFLACVGCSIAAVLVFERRRIGLPVVPFAVVGPRAAIIALFGLLMLETVPISLAFFGGGGDFASVVQVLVAMVLVVFSARRLGRLRFASYAAIFGFLVFAMTQDKRIAVFFLASVGMYELRNHVRLHISWAAVLGSVVIVILSIVAVLTMSIARGYGSLGTEGDVRASLAALPTYLRSNNVVGSVFVNLEWTVSYFHSVNSVDYVLSHPDSYLYGATYAKTLLIPIPRSVVPSKPDNYIGVYTQRVNPAYRAAGGSWPPNAYAEAFGNFGFVGGLSAMFLISGLFAGWFNEAFGRIRRYPWRLESALFVAIYLFFFEYARGFGLDGLGAVICVLFLCSLPMAWVGDSYRASPA